MHVSVAPRIGDHGPIRLIKLFYCNFPGVQSQLINLDGAMYMNVCVADSRRRFNVNGWKILVGGNRLVSKVEGVVQCGVDAENNDRNSGRDVYLGETKMGGAHGRSG